MSGTTNRAFELRKNLIKLYGQGKRFDYGSLVYDYPGSSPAQEEVVELLSLQYDSDFQFWGLGLHMGYASFVDCIIGKSRCYRKPRDEFGSQKCVYVLLSHYTNIYVIGEFSYSESGGFSLPSFETVDTFTTNRTKELSSEISLLLKPANYQRVYASELSESIPEGIETQSNLAGEQLLVFDGYFNWTD